MPQGRREQLGREVAGRAGVVLTDGQVAARAGAAGQGEAQCVGTEFVDPVQRVDAVALGLAHLLAFRVADQAVHIDVLERDLAGDVLGHHDHARHPEEDDVEAGDEHR